MNEKINLQELASLLTEKAGTTKKEAESFLREFFDLISEALISEKQIKIKNLGSFKLVEVEDRESINVRTGERVLIPAHSKVSFSPDKQLSEIINEPFALFEPVEVDEDTVIDPAKEDESEDSDEAGEVIAEVVKTTETADPEQKETEMETTEQKEIGATTITELPKEEEVIMKNEEKAPEIQEHEYFEESVPQNKTFRTIRITAFTILALAALVYFFFPDIKTYFSSENRLVIQPTVIRQNPEPAPVVIPDTVTTNRADSSSLRKEPQAPVVKTDAIAPKMAKEISVNTARRRLIKAGERLTVISLKEYGDKIFWIYLYEENKKIIENPNNLPVGLEIVIPPAGKYGIDIKNPESVSKAKKLAENYK